MKLVWQVMLWCGLLAPLSGAGEQPAPFKWEPVKIQVSAFSPELGLLDAERNEYATNLADCAAQCLLTGKANPETVERARRLLLLALNLSPRNRRAIVVNFQLSKGLAPERAKGDFSPTTMARLLSTRSQILAKSASQEDRLLARMFCRLAADLDPKNEDAVYASEVDRLDHGTLDWTFLSRPRPEPPGTAPAAPATPATPPPGPVAPPRP